jgi:hypothetical protein
MDPAISGFDTVFADVLLTVSDSDLIEMRAAYAHRVSFLSSKSRSQPAKFAPAS